jgi:hypothetical protein
LIPLHSIWRPEYNAPAFAKAAARQARRRRQTSDVVKTSAFVETMADPMADRKARRLKVDFLHFSL